MYYIIISIYFVLIFYKKEKPTTLKVTLFRYSSSRIANLEGFMKIKYARFSGLRTCKILRSGQTNLFVTLVSWVLHKIKTRGPLRYLHFWTNRGQQGIGIVSEKSKPLLIGSYVQFFLVAITQPFFVSEQNNKIATPPKLSQIIWVSEVNFTLKLILTPFFAL